jgi:hypothetical protein
MAWIEQMDFLNDIYWNSIELGDSYVGLLHPYDANFVKTKIILLTKFYIFRTKVNEGMVNFEALKKNYTSYNPLLLFCKEKCLFPIFYG